MPGFASLSVISAAAMRVASLDLCADEYLLMLARPTEIASVSRVSHDRFDSPLWRAARRHRANQGNVESLLPVRPSIMLAMGGGNASSAIARRLRWKVLSLPYPTTIADVEANMIRVAATLGDPARADPWRRRLAVLRHSLPPARAAIFLSSNGDTLPATSLGAEWMRLGGYRQRAVPGGRVTLETLALHPPPYLLLSNYRQGQESIGQRWLRHPLVERAKSQRRITDGRPWTCGGPLMVPEIERLRAAR
jgi:iron complex transport system substrate-binding protein